MFDQFMGLPVHAIVVHAAVVFGPLAGLTAIAYALVPRLRPNLKWWLAGFSLVTGITSFVAAQSGEELEHRLITDANRNTPFAEAIRAHAENGDQMKLFGLIFMVIAVAAVFLLPTDRASESTVLHKVFAGVLVIAAAVMLYQVVITGHTGAEAVWGSGG